MDDLSPLALPVALIGHPFAPIGRGEDLRSSYRAFKAVGVNAQIVDIYEGGDRDCDLAAEFQQDLRRTTGGGVDVFLINGDEIEAALAHLGSRRRQAAHTAILPVWELAQYPGPWARQLDRFDEVWAPSAFIRDAILPVVGVPVVYLPWAAGVKISRFLGRRYFGIPESAFAFLFAFDLRSYHQRKNPLAVLDAYAELVRARPKSDSALIIKISGTDVHPEAAADLRQRLMERSGSLGLGRLVMIERGLTESETKNLVRCCDCFVSLHRSEGFGRFLAEAMILGKPVIATAYSGNMDFMATDVACLVGYRLVPVVEGEYPYATGQVWADPNVDEALTWMIRLVDDPALGRRIGERASSHMRSRFSYRAVGVRYLAHLRGVCSQLGAVDRSTAAVSRVERR
jgi:glycosyltransferase involved in cell wall biosynthesis